MSSVKLINYQSLQRMGVVPATRRRKPPTKEAPVKEKEQENVTVSPSREAGQESEKQAEKTEEKAIEPQQTRKASQTKSGQNRNLTQEQIDFPRVRLNGAIQLGDGLFISDKIGAGDSNFLRSNQVQRILNTAPQEVLSLFDTNEFSRNPAVQEAYNNKSAAHRKLMGTIQYLNYDWKTRELPQSPYPFTSKALRKDILDFIDGGLEQCRTVLIVSARNNCRSILVAALYLMQKYDWTLSKTLEYLCYKKPDLVLTTELYASLQIVEKDIQNEKTQTLESLPGFEAEEERPPLLGTKTKDIQEQEELAIQYGYKNSKKPESAGHWEQDGAGQQSGGEALKRLIEEAKRETMMTPVKGTGSKGKKGSAQSEQKSTASPSTKKETRGLDWELGPQLSKEEAKTLQAKRFNKHHFENRKPSPKKRRQKRQLTVVKENTHETTQTTNKTVKSANDNGARARRRNLTLPQLQLNSQDIHSERGGSVGSSRQSQSSTRSKKAARKKASKFKGINPLDESSKGPSDLRSNGSATGSIGALNFFDAPDKTAPSKTANGTGNAAAKGTRGKDSGVVRAPKSSSSKQGSVSLVPYQLRPSQNSYLSYGGLDTGIILKKKQLPKRKKSNIIQDLALESVPTLSDTKGTLGKMKPKKKPQLLMKQSDYSNTIEPEQTTQSSQIVLFMADNEIQEQKKPLQKPQTSQSTGNLRLNEDPAQRSNSIKNQTLVPDPLEGSDRQSSSKSERAIIKNVKQKQETTKPTLTKNLSSPQVNPDKIFQKQKLESQQKEEVKQIQPVIEKQQKSKPEATFPLESQSTKQTTIEIRENKVGIRGRMKIMTPGSRVIDSNSLFMSSSEAEDSDHSKVRGLHKIADQLVISEIKREIQGTTKETSVSKPPISNITLKRKELLIDVLPDQIKDIQIATTRKSHKQLASKVMKEHIELLSQPKILPKRKKVKQSESLSKKEEITLLPVIFHKDNSSLSHVLPKPKKLANRKRGNNREASKSTIDIQPANRAKANVYQESYVQAAPRQVRYSSTSRAKDQQGSQSSESLDIQMLTRRPPRAPKRQSKLQSISLSIETPRKPHPQKVSATPYASAYIFSALEAQSSSRVRLKPLQLSSNLDRESKRKLSDQQKPVGKKKVLHPLVEGQIISIPTTNLRQVKQKQKL